MKIKKKVLTSLIIIGIMLLTGCIKQTEMGLEVIEDANELHNLVNEYNNNLEEINN